MNRLQRLVLITAAAIAPLFVFLAGAAASPATTPTAASPAAAPPAAPGAAVSSPTAAPPSSPATAAVTATAAPADVEPPATATAAGTPTPVPSMEDQQAAYAAAASSNFQQAAELEARCLGEVAKLRATAQMNAGAARALQPYIDAAKEAKP